MQKLSLRRGLSCRRRRLTGRSSHAEAQDGQRKFVHDYFDPIGEEPVPGEFENKMTAGGRGLNQPLVLTKLYRDPSEPSIEFPC